MDARARPGHVSRAQLFSEGSVFARQLARTAGDEGAAIPDDELLLLPAQLTMQELWDARHDA